MSFDLLISSLLAAFVALTAAFFLVPAVGRLSRSLDLVDRPDSRKLQPQPVPILGGVAMVGAMILGVASTLAVEPFLAAASQGFSSALPARPPIFLAAVGLIFVLGLLDDLRGLSPLTKLVVQVAAAAVLVADGCTFQEVNLPFLEGVPMGAFGALGSLLWIVGITNAVNFIDGIDGLAAGLAAITSASLIAFALLQQNPASVILLSVMAGASLGFLPHNWPPARIFMGDAGSLTLGFLLGAVSLHSGLKAPATVALLVPILALGLPIIDTLLVMAARFAEDTGASLPRRLRRILKADRNHLHHLFVTLVPFRRRAVAWLYGIVALFCAMALLVATTRNTLFGIFLLVIQVAVVVMIRRAAGRLPPAAISPAERPADAARP